MILTGPEILRQWQRGRLAIDPFNEAHLNPDSYDFCLGETLRVYTTFPLDPKGENPTKLIAIPPEGLTLDPQRLYLGTSRETIGSTHYVPTFAARSSVARLGLFINLSAGMGSLGEIDHLPLHLFAIHPLRVYAGMRIGQIMWWTTRRGEKRS